MKPLRRVAALRWALGRVGVHEQPAGSNRGPKIDAWNTLAGVPLGSYWCCSFVHAAFRLSAANVNLGGGASVSNLLGWARSAGMVVSRPRRGDIVCFEFGEGPWAFDDHVGIVVRCLALRFRGGRFTGWIRTVEGNTSRQGDTFGSQSNGGGVYVRRRWVRGIGATFVRVPGRTR